MKPADPSLGPSQDILNPPSGSVFSSSPSLITVAHLLSTVSSVSLLLTPPLARDLAPDLLSLLSHTQPKVRKQTVLAAWRILRSWPGVLELSTGREERGEDPWVARLRERLNDDNPGVVSAAVNLICECARKDPAKYLPLAPELFGLLTEGTNNWMLIKIVKLVSPLSAFPCHGTLLTSRSAAAVRGPDATRAATGAQAGGAAHRADPHHLRHVAPL